MKSEDRSLFSRVAIWLGAKSNAQYRPSQEIERLRLEQLRLSAELEGLLSSYDEQTKKLASNLVASEDSLSDSELRKLVEDQQRLWRIIRRLQAGERTIPQLEQEYMEWKGRKEEGLSELHPDHPNVRLELIASELRARGRSVPVNNHALTYEGSAKDADPFEDLNLNDEEVDNESMDESQDESLQEMRLIPISSEIQDALLNQIRECGLQIKKTQGRQDITPQDLAEIYSELRRHHASLRSADRRTGVKRYRVVLHE